MKKYSLYVSGFIIGISLMYMLVGTIIANQLKEKVLSQHPEIEHIDCMTRIGAWGEWFSEYVLEVEMNGKMFRIWVNEKGNIVDEEPL